MASSKSSMSSFQDEEANRGQFLTSLNDNAIDLDFYQRIIGGQIFIGMITLQQQAKQDIPSLVEDLDNAGIRFVHFSEENEVKSRVFAERLGLETGWNCHISFSEKTTGFDEHSTLTSGSDGKIDETADEYLVSHEVPAHSEGAEVMKEGDEVYNEEEDEEVKQVDEMDLVEHGGAVGDVEMAGDEENGKKVKWRESEENIDDRARKLSESTSSSSVSNIDEEDGENQGAYNWDFNNRAKLPRGIGNIRPHLKHVDNVPLLVPLFTDCTPEAIREMIAIMQEYGEVVCCIGSSLNVANVQIFNEADISIALQPSFPQVCLKDRTQLFDSRSSTVAPTSSRETDVLLATESGHSPSRDLTPLEVSSSLNAISCSLSFRRDYNIKFVALLKEARRLCFGLHNCFSFMLSCQLTLCLVMFAASLFMLPPPMTGLHLLWFSCVSVPVLSTSLVNAANDSDLMTMIMAKNDKNFVGYIWSFVRLLGLAFLPPVLLCDLLIFPLTLRSFCQRFDSSDNQCYYFHGKRNNSEFWYGFGETHLSGLDVAQDVVAFFLMLCFVFMSTSYVHRLHPLWRRSPFSNKQWICAVFIVFSLQVLYTAFSRVLWRITATKNKKDYRLSQLPRTVVCLVSLWPFVQLFLCELLKRKYIKFFIRYQKRAKLKFGTKLGMNSPF